MFGIDKIAHPRRADKASDRITKLYKYAILYGFTPLASMAIVESTVSSRKNTENTWIEVVDNGTSDNHVFLLLA